MSRIVTPTMIEQSFLKEGIELPTISAFLAYHKKYPQIWEHFSKFALEKLTKGQKVGCRTVMERVRWEVNDVRKSDGFKCNNDWTPYYGRVFLMFYPQYSQVFKLRKATGIRRLRSRRGEQREFNLRTAA